MYLFILLKSEINNILSQMRWRFKNMLKCSLTRLEGNETMCVYHILGLHSSLMHQSGCKVRYNKQGRWLDSSSRILNEFLENVCLKTQASWVVDAL